jgi:hypothetical protein
VPDYRVFLIDQNGRVARPAEIIVADTDEQAIAVARKLADGCDVEVWHLARRVITLKGSP